MQTSTLDYLLEAAAWQDSLLQSYRSLHITIQSILLATATVLFVAIVSLSGFISSVVSFVVLVTMWVLQRFAAQKFKQIIFYRGEDVNYWHREIILAEQQTDIEHRYFTKFKIYQKLHRHDAQYLQDIFPSSQKASTSDIDILVEKGLGHTRQAVDEQLFQRISWIWVSFIVISLVFVAIRSYMLFQ